MSDGWAGLALLDALSNAGLGAWRCPQCALLMLGVNHWRTRQQASTRLARFGLVAADGVPGSVDASRDGADLLRRLGARLVRWVPAINLMRVHEALVRAGLADRVSAEEFLGLRSSRGAGGNGRGPISPGTGAAVPWHDVERGRHLARTGRHRRRRRGRLSGPALLLTRRARQRRAAIERLLPNTADVLVVSLEAGLGFDSVIAFVAERADNPLTVLR